MFSHVWKDISLGCCIQYIYLCVHEYCTGTWFNACCWYSPSLDFLRGFRLVISHDLNKSFGGLKAVNNVNLKVDKGSITGLIGPNGAGKTTLFNTIAGLYAPDNGDVYLEEKNIAGLKPHELFGMGVLRTFQIAHEFASLTVLENLMMVPGNQRGEKLIYALFGDKAVKKEEEEIRAKAIEVIEFLNLKHLTQEMAGNL